MNEITRQKSHSLETNITLVLISGCPYGWICESTCVFVELENPLMDSSPITGKW